MRALLVVNPSATTTTARARQVLESALGAEVKLDVATTTHRGHAAELASSAQDDGYGAVVALGGDGTVNEVADGLLRRSPHGGEADDLPALGVVPGGSTNVFARAVGVANDPIEATGQLLEALRQERTRTIGVGRADDRVFLFNAGLGVDAEVVARVEERRAEGSRASNGLYFRQAVRHLLHGVERRTPPLVVRVGEEPPRQVFAALVTNTTPWTYLAGRPVTATPQSRFELGLDVFTLGSLHLLPTLRTTVQMLGARGPRGRSVVLDHDVRRVVLAAREPVALQVDGDHLGAVDRVVVTAVPRALRVLV